MNNNDTLQIEIDRCEKRILEIKKQSLTNKQKTNLIAIYKERINRYKNDIILGAENVKD
jgi:hypothetical protein